MRTLLPFLAALMLVLTGWVGMAHAAEAAGGGDAGIAFGIHAPGDGDEVPGDDDNAFPHHHTNCHGHDIGTPATTTAGADGSPGGRIRVAHVADSLAGLPGRVLPRPPRA